MLSKCLTKDNDCNIIFTVQMAFSLNKCNFSLSPLSMQQVYFRGLSHRTEMEKLPDKTRTSHHVEKWWGLSFH